MDTLEEDMSGVKQTLEELNKQAQRAAGVGAALAVIWAIYGENIKHMVGGAK